jgi:HD superfamily phosphohydrolase
MKMMEIMRLTTNKVFGLFLAICFCITAPSCGVFKKNIIKSGEKIETLTSIQDKTKTLTNSLSNKRIFEEVEFNFKFSEPKERGFSEPIEYSEKKDSTFTGVITKADFNQLLDRVQSLNIKINRQQLVQKEEARTEEKDIKNNTETKKNTKTFDKQTNKNTTLAANIPWYAWVIAAALIFWIFWYLVKQVKGF